MAMSFRTVSTALATLCGCAAGLGGCFATFERNIDLVLGADALQNALVLPYAGLGRAALWLAGLI